MAVNQHKTEIKYDAPADVALPGLEQLPRVATVRGPEEQRLEAEYYDTDDLRLIRAGITLWQRSGGGDAGRQLKLPAAADTCREIRRTPGAGASRIPGELAGLVRVHARGAPLRPVTRMTTIRRRRILLNPAGQSLAEVASDDVSAQTLGRTAVLSRWQEVEVELTGGDRSLLEMAGNCCAAMACARLAGRPGWSGHWTAGCRKRRTAPRRPHPRPRGEVVLAYLRAHTETLKALGPMVRLDDLRHRPSDAGRRAPAAQHAPAFRHILAPDDIGEPAAGLHWLGSAL